MHIQIIDTNKIIPYARNPRNNDMAVAAVAASILEFGFRQPIVTDENLVVLVGDTRLKAARKLDMATVPVHIAEGLTEAQKKAYRIADNKLNEISQWDNELLALEVEELKTDDFDLDLLGFSDKELDELFGVGESEADSPENGINYDEKYAILVECADETDQQGIFDRLTEQGYTCKVLVN